MDGFQITVRNLEHHIFTITLHNCNACMTLKQFSGLRAVRLVCKHAVIKDTLEIWLSALGSVSVCADVYPDLWNLHPPPRGEKKDRQVQIENKCVCVCVRVYICVWMADRKGRADREGKAEGVKVLLLKQAIYKKRLQACCQITQYARACTRTHTHTAHQTGCVWKGDRKWQSQRMTMEGSRGGKESDLMKFICSLCLFSAALPRRIPVLLPSFCPSGSHLLSPSFSLLPKQRQN